jgi:uncharacterized protein Yka (UPF0111/DUF47 family)
MITQTFGELEFPTAERTFHIRWDCWLGASPPRKPSGATAAGRHVFDQLRTEDVELFRQLGRITRDIARSTILLERLLAGPRSATAGIGLEVRQQAANRELDQEDEEMDVRSFAGFAMRLDAAEYRELALTLDAAAEAVHSAISHVESLDSGDAPRGIRALAQTLASAASALERAVPLAGKNSNLVPRGGSDVQRIADVGETIYFDGVSALFDGVPDVMHVLRWKGIYERLWQSLDSCARGATVLEQLARANT